MTGVLASTLNLGERVPRSWNRLGQNVIWNTVDAAQNPPINPLVSGVLLSPLSNYTNDTL